MFLPLSQALGRDGAGYTGVALCAFTLRLTNLDSRSQERVPIVQRQLSQQSHCLQLALVKKLNMTAIGPRVPRALPRLATVSRRDIGA